MPCWRPSTGRPRRSHERGHGPARRARSPDRGERGSPGCPRGHPPRRGALRPDHGAVKTLGPDQALVLRAPFEPVPLLRGAGQARLRALDEQSAPTTTGPSGSTASRQHGNLPPQVRARPDDRDWLLDVSGLEPPEPMLRVLERLDTLAVRTALRPCSTSGGPCFLYPQLDERGFLHDTEELEPGLVRIVIRRADRAAVMSERGVEQGGRRRRRCRCPIS